MPKKKQTNKKELKNEININKAVKSLNSDVVKNVTDEWSGVEPTNKSMGLVPLTLDRGVKTTIVGTVYGMNFEIEDAEYKVNVFFDYYNRRLKILNYYCKTKYGGMLKRLAWLAEANSFDKIFVKAKEKDFQKFLSHGYMLEGIIKYYFDGEDAYVLSRFSSVERAKSSKLIKESELIEDIIYRSNPPKKRFLPKNIKIVRATKADISKLVYIYRQVFETYPSPLTSPDYIESVINQDVYFLLALEDGEPVAAASAEINRKHLNAELTDCASIPVVQGKGIMQFILRELEKMMIKEGMTSLYTLARSQSIGMNKSFFRLSYEYSGRLINNCDIFGSFEDLNIWAKKI
ncbi:MAG: putative beta-lysine N-acetyltransferase [Elusimicrobiota bacterium]|nr:putative beta-lysine N-acetyltransferase [Elusimicrobiota bacterium]